MNGLPLSRLDWVIAWRHLRMGDEVPAWVRWIVSLSAYLIVVGGLLAWHALSLGEGDHTMVTLMSRAGPELLQDGVSNPLQQSYGIFAAITIVVGVMGLALGLLGRFFNLLPTIITESVLLGCMALVVVLSLMSGLEGDMRDKILAQRAHIRVSRANGRFFADYGALTDALAAGDGIAGASPYLEGEVMVRSGLNRQGAVLLGIIPERQVDVSDLKSLVHEGSYDYLSHPEEIPEYDPFTVIDSKTPWRLRHLQNDGEDEKNQLQPSSEDTFDPPATDKVNKLPKELEALVEGESQDGALLRDLPSVDELESLDDGGWEDPAELEDNRSTGDDHSSAEVGDPTNVDIDDEGWEDPSGLGADDENPEAPEVEPDPESQPPVEPESQSGGIPGPILIGEELSSELSVVVGVDVQLITPIGRITPAGQLPGLLGVRVAGLFRSGMYEYDRKNVYAPLDLVQRFLLAGDRVSGIEVKLDNIDAIDAGKREVQRIVEAMGRSDELIVEDWRDLNRNLFSAMFLEKVAMFIALLFVVLVASFGILASNLMSVMEKSKEIAILKAMGMTDTGIMRVFIAEGLCVGLLGSFGGIALGLQLCEAIKTYGLPIKNVFYIEKMPVVVNSGEVALIGVAAMVIVCISSVYPALVASRMRPVDALRQGD